MNAITNRNRTLGELMTELRARLSQITTGSAAKGNDLLIKSFLQEAHEYVYGELEPPAQRKKTMITLEAGSYLYDWHNDTDDEDIDPGRVLSMWVKVGDTIREPLTQGISEFDRSFQSLRDQPSKYDTLDGQLEIYPVPNMAYDLVIEYTGGIGRFDRATDRTSVPDRLVFLYALATAKSHYRHPDAKAAATSFTNMLGKEKMRQRENRRYYMAGFGPSDHKPAGGNGGSYAFVSSAAQIYEQSSGD